MIKNKFIKTLLQYTIYFGIIMFFISYLFANANKNFIWIYDGFSQHFITLNYFKYIFTNLLSLNGFHTFTWNLGFGLDMFTNLAYYNFGDIFSYISLLVPNNLMKYLYSFLTVIRLYCAGISFLLYCRYKKELSTSSVIGSLIYVFCSFSLLSAFRHPYFINPMIVFPITMIGIEKFINEDKKILFVFSVFLMFFSSFYFGYMNALIIMIYGIILSFYKYKKDYKKVITVLFKAFLYALLGIFMDGVFLLPTIYQFLTSTRLGVMPDISYSINYYRSLLKSLFAFNFDATSWAFIGMSSLVILTTIKFIKYRKKQLPLFILMLVLFIPLISSKASYIISGFSFPSNRYIYMLIFVLSFIATFVLNRIKQMNIKKYILILIPYLLLLVIFKIDLTYSLIISLVAYLLILFSFEYKDKLKFNNKNYLLVVINLIVVLNILFQVFYLYSTEYNDYITKYTENDTLEYTYDSVKEKYDNFDSALKYIKDKDKSFYLIGKNSNDWLWNLSLIKNYNSPEYYYSINSHLYQDLAFDLNNSQHSVNSDIKEFNNRGKITSLLGVKYFIDNDENFNLYNYKLDKVIGNTYVYENKNSIDFAKIYHECLNTKTYDQLNPLEKEDALLKYYISDNCKNENVKLSSIKNIKYKTENNLKDSIINVGNEEDKIILKPKEKINGELYVKINNIKFEDSTFEDYQKYYDEYNNILLEEKKPPVILKDIDRLQLKSFNRYNDKYKDFTVQVKTSNFSRKEEVIGNNKVYYTGDNDILINLGYFTDYKKQIKITFSEIGKYSFDSIKLYSTSFADVQQDIEKLNQADFQVEDIKDNYLRGNVNINKEGILSFSTLYNKGWEVLVDGKKVETLKNKYFLAINISKGKHTIEMNYKTPYLKIGLILSVISWLIFFIVSILNINKKL